MSGWLYALLCLVVPALWGVLMYYLFGWIQRRRRQVTREDAPPVDYSI